MENLCNSWLLMIFSVHFDNLEAIYAPPIPATDLDHTESAGISGEYKILIIKSTRTKFL